MEAARLVVEGLAPQHREVTWDLVYCSRSGSPRTPWLEPDVNDHLEQLAAEGVTSVVVVPIGFVSDHMEVVYDLDTEAAETAEKLGMRFVRVPTPGTHPSFVAMITDLLQERASVDRGEDPTPATLGRCGANPWVCVPGCCANLRGDRPAHP